jgi:hypothetical protein
MNVGHKPNHVKIFCLFYFIFTFILFLYLFTNFFIVSKPYAGASFDHVEFHFYFIFSSHHFVSFDLIFFFFFLFPSLLIVFVYVPQIYQRTNRSMIVEIFRFNSSFFYSDSRVFYSFFLLLLLYFSFSEKKKSCLQLWENLEPMIVLFLILL